MWMDEQTVKKSSVGKVDEDYDFGGGFCIKVHRHFLDCDVFFYLPLDGFHFDFEFGVCFFTISGMRCFLQLLTWERIAIHSSLLPSLALI